jgi:putative hydrolase of the HAD superfamily
MLHTTKAVLFDFGGVLAEEGFHNGLQSLAREQGLDAMAISAIATDAVYDSGFVLGKSNAADFWALMRERIGLRGEDEVLSRRILEGFVPRDWMLTQVQQLRSQDYITCILSDQTHWLSELDEQYHFYQYFDYIFNSYELGKGKRDLSLFDDIAQRLQLPPSSLLFVDDSADNIARARAAGWKVIHYVDQDSFMQELQKQLQR